jgi:hypothetical protein
MPENAAACPSCNVATARKAERSVNPFAVVLTIIGSLLIALIVISSPPRSPAMSLLSAPPGQMASSAPAAATAAQSSPDGGDVQAGAPDPTDLTKNAEFLAKYPGYVEAVRKLIVDSGHSCETMASLWTRGDSPDGTRLEAQCGADANDIIPSEHYAVYPEKLNVHVCGNATGEDCR